MMKLYTIFILLLGSLLASCVPQDSATQVTCNPGSSFNPATRECESVQIVMSFTIEEGATQNFTIDGSALVPQTPVGCEVLSTNKGIVASCACIRGSCYVTIGPDSVPVNGISDPAYPDFYGPTDFVFRVFDGVNYSGNVWANVDVTNKVDAPYANDQNMVFTAEGQRQTIALDAGDVDKDALTYTITISPSFGEVSIDSLGNLTVDYSATNPLNDGFDTNYSGTDVLRYEVSDGQYTATASVSIQVPSSDYDIPVVLPDDLTQTQTDLNNDPTVAEEQTFTVPLPFTEFDTGESVLSCEVNFDDPNNKIAPVNPTVAPNYANGCTCTLAPPTYNTYSCSVPVQGLTDQYGQTQLTYRIKTGGLDPTTQFWTAWTTVVFDLDETNDAPLPVREEVAYSNTEVHSSAMQVAFQISPAANVDSSTYDPSSSFVYTLKTPAAAGTVTNCISGTTIDITQPCYYKPTDTTVVGQKWTSSSTSLEGITYTANRKGSWGDGISVQVIETSTVSAGNATVSTNLTTNQISVMVNTVGGTTAQNVYDALIADAQTMSLITPTLTNAATVQVDSALTNLTGGLDGVDVITYSVTDTKNTTSLYDGVIYISAQGIYEELGRNTHYLNLESATNLPLTYSDIEVDPTYDGNYTFIESTLGGPAATFDSSCLTNTAAQCSFTPENGDVNGIWGAASATDSNITYEARRMGIIGNSITINFIDDGTVTANGDEIVTVNYATQAITINIASGVTTGQSVQLAILNHPVANGLVTTDVIVDSLQIAPRTVTLAGGTNGVAYVRYWYSTGTPVAVNKMGILYIDLSDVPNASEKYFDAPTLCHYGSAFEYPECGENGCIGDTSPIGVVTPSKAGIYYYQNDIVDTDPNGPGAICYRSTGTTSSSWEIVTDKNLYLGVNYKELGDLTFFAKLDSSTYSVVLAAGGTAGAETVSLSGQTITVTIEDGVSTATQISSAINNIANVSSNLIYAFVSGNGATAQTAGSVVLDQNSGESYTINENDSINIKRIRLDEGDGDDILNAVGAYTGQCTITDIQSSDTTLVPASPGNISLIFNGTPYFTGGVLDLAGTSLDTQDISFKINPAASTVGNSIVNVLLTCARPTPDDDGVLPNVGDLPDDACSGALCTSVTGTTTVSIIFKVNVNEAGITHNGWKNIIALGPKVDRFGHALDVCPYDSSGCNGGECTGTTVPFSVVTPSSAGLYYYDTASSHCYISTGTTSSDWDYADCSTSYSYDEPECNGSATTVDRCVGTAAPSFTPAKLNSMYYDQASQKCYRSTGTAAVTDWKEYMRSGQVRVQWEDFTLNNSAQTISGFNLYRRLYSETEFDYEKPINKTVIASTVNYFDDNIENSVSAPVPGTTYYYEVRPIINGIPTSAGTSTFSQVKVVVPPPNMAFVSRRIVNKTMCNLMNKTADKTNNNRCTYYGPGSNSGYYDIGSDYIVDRFEQGCPYSAAPACDPTNGCIGTVSPSATVTGANGDVYYDRSTGMCYVNSGGGTTWNPVTGSDLTGKVASLDAATNVYVSKLAHLPPLTNVDQSTADSFCTSRTSFATTDILGVASPVSMELPDRREQIAYSVWDDSINDDTTITGIEHGLDLNNTHKCNSSSASGIDTSFVDSDVPPVAVQFTVAGTASSTIRSLWTGSDWTDTCVSKFGIQDTVGNVAEWTQDRLFCTSPYVCEFVTNDAGTYESSFSSLTGQAFNANELETPDFFNQFSYSSTTPYCSGSISGECYGDASPIAEGVTPGAIGVRYLDRTNHLIYKSTGTTSADWVLDVTLNRTVPTALNTDAIWKTPLFDGTFSDNYLDTDETNDNDFYLYRFDGQRGPCVDTDASNSCNGELTEWYIPTPDTVYADRIFVPMGMPVSSIINTNAVAAGDLESVANDALKMNSSGISTSKLHNDHIQIYSDQIFSDASACGSMLTGGSYESGDKAGVYSSQFTPCATPFYSTSGDMKPSSSAVGFRCVGKIP